MNTTLNASATVHTATTHEGNIIGTRCSAESLGKARARRFRKTTDAVTCKRCLKMAASRDEAAAPVQAPAARELTVFHVGSRRTRTSGPRHPLERQPLPAGFFHI